MEYISLIHSTNLKDVEECEERNRQGTKYGKHSFLTPNQILGDLTSMVKAPLNHYVIPNHILSFIMTPLHLKTRHCARKAAFRCIFPYIHVVPHDPMYIKEYPPLLPHQFLQGCSIKEA